jgi:hypothetical protein
VDLQSARVIPSAVRSGLSCSFAAEIITDWGLVNIMAARHLRKQISVPCLASHFSEDPNKQKSQRNAALLRNPSPAWQGNSLFATEKTLGEISSAGAETE